MVEEGAATTMADFLGENTSDPGATGKNIYSNPQNLPTAIASILNKSQNRANFHPAVDTPEEVKKTYASYIKEIDGKIFSLNQLLIIQISVLLNFLFFIQP